MAASFKLDENCTFHPYEGSSSAEEFLLRTPGGRQFRLSPLAKEILQSLDGKTSLETIAQSLQSRSIAISAVQLQSFLEEQYGTLGIFAGYTPPNPEPEQSGQQRKSPIPIFLHWRVLPAGIVVRVSRLFNALFNRFVVVAGILAMTASHYWLYRHALPDFSDAQPDINLLLVTLLTLLSVLFHELGHASAVTRYGGSPGSIGFGLYGLMPSFYADVSEIWRFPRRQRMIVDCGGVYFQQLVLCVFAVLCYFTRIPELAVACTILDAMVLLTLNPVFQFDGYWFLVDYLGLPDLRGLAWGQLKRWILRSKDIPALPPMRRDGRLVFLVYVAGSAGFVALLLRMEYRYLLRPAALFVTALPKLFDILVGALKAHEFLKFGNSVLALLYVFSVPLSAFIGLGAYAIRIYRYFARRNRPILRRFSGD